MSPKLSQIILSHTIIQDNKNLNCPSHVKAATNIEGVIVYIERRKIYISKLYFKLKDSSPLDQSYFITKNLISKKKFH